MTINPDLLTSMLSIGLDGELTVSSVFPERFRSAIAGLDETALIEELTILSRIGNTFASEKGGSSVQQLLNAIYQEVVRQVVEQRQRQRRARERIGRSWATWSATPNRLPRITQQTGNLLDVLIKRWQ